MLLFPAERAREVLQAWREWTATVPDSVTTSARIMQLPPLPELPEFLRGRSVVIIDGADRRARRARRRAARPAARARPGDGHLRLRSRPSASRASTWTPRSPMPGISDSRLLDGLTAETIDALVDAAGPGSGSPLLMVELRHLGGALEPLRGRRAEPLRRRVPVLRGRHPDGPGRRRRARGAVRDRRPTRWRRSPAAASTSTSPSGPTDPVAFYGEETYARPPARQGRGRPAGALPRQPRDPLRRKHAPRGGPPADGRPSSRCYLAASPRRPRPPAAALGRGAGLAALGAEARSPSAPAARRRCASPLAVLAEHRPDPAAEEADRDRHQAGERERRRRALAVRARPHRRAQPIITIDAITPKATPVSAPAVLKRRQ